MSHWFCIRSYSKRSAITTSALTRSVLPILLGLLLSLDPRVASLSPFDKMSRRASAQETSPARQSATAGIEYMARVMDQFHDRFPVYDNVSSAGNHFHAFAKIPDSNAPVDINGSATDNPHSMPTAIRCKLHIGSGPFGGFYFQNGVLPAGETVPQLNFGVVPNAGVNLTGATALTFWARGEHGGEVLEFFMGGVGRDSNTGTVLNPCTPDFSGPCPAPDSTPVVKISVILTSQWQQYRIDLSNKNLSYVLGGFGWVASVQNNPSGVVFYLDDIQYELSSTRRAQRLNEPRFLVSFTTLPVQPDPFDANTDDDIDFVLRNSAFVYDNAVALLAFLADGTDDSLRRAKLIGNAFVYASQHDRAYDDGRLRSVYAAGDISLPPGWTPNGRSGTVPIPGFYYEPERKFYEIEQESVDTGNNAWAMIALLALYHRTADQSYLDTARKLGNFIHTFRNDTGTYKGFQGGLDHYPESPMVMRRTYASTEHNLDVNAAFTAMFQITREAQWQADAQHAQQFVEAMWDAPKGCYLAGTTNPETRNMISGQLPLDVQAWSVLALPDALTLHPQVLNCAELNHRNTHDQFSGFDFNDDKDGVWFEGTAQMAAAYAFATQAAAAESLRQELRRAQQTSPVGDGRGIAAASHDGLSTGFNFKYFRRLHVGATAWTVFGQLEFNPFYQTSALSNVQFNSASYSVSEGAGSAVITVTHTGDTSGSASVAYATVDDPAAVRCDDTVNNHGAAYARCDYATTIDTLTFAPGNTTKTFTIPLMDDAHVEGNETVQLRLSNPVGATLGNQSTATLMITDNDTNPNAPNPIQAAAPGFFVRQHYLDFLSREPEQGEPWSGVLNGCQNQFNTDPTNPSASCDRLIVSQSFYGSPEFQLKGYFVYRFYKLAFNRLPQYAEIIPDMRAVAGQTSQEVFQKKATFTSAFVQRQEFVNTYSALSNSAYVAALMNRYSLTQITTPDPANPDGTQKVTLTSADLTNRLTANMLTRAQALRAIADSDQVFQLEFNQAFVAMQYYGYLRRTPETSGFNAWLTYLNAHPTDSRTMVNGFMNSIEYRLRFGQP